MGFEEFAAALDRYIEWYRSGKLKKALGWKTIRQARSSRTKTSGVPFCTFQARPVLCGRVLHCP